jgi:NADH dehydrogenase
MTFVIVGGGPTGVELAGALGEIANDTLRRDFRSIDPSQARIVLVEAMDRILLTYPPDRSASAKKQLERLGVEVRTDTRVVHIDDSSVRVMIGDREETWPSRTALWAAGVRCRASWRRSRRPPARSRISRPDPRRAGPDDRRPPRDLRRRRRRGRAVASRPADAGRRPGRDPGGSHAARQVRRRLRGLPTLPFQYSNHGDVAVIGRLAGVTDIPWMGPFGKQGGFIAWALWLLIHITYLIGFANRVVVVTRWGWSFFTHGRGSRLITGEPLLPPIEEPEPPVSPT